MCPSPWRQPHDAQLEDSDDVLAPHHGQRRLCAAAARCAGEPKGDEASKRLEESLKNLDKKFDDMIKRLAAIESKKPTMAGEESVAEIKELNKKLDDLVKLNKEIAYLKTELLNHRLQFDELNRKIAAIGPSGSPAVDKAFMDELRGVVQAAQRHDRGQERNDREDEPDREAHLHLSAERHGQPGPGGTRQQLHLEVEFRRQRPRAMWSSQARPRR